MHGNMTFCPTTSALTKMISNIPINSSLKHSPLCLNVNILKYVLFAAVLKNKHINSPGLTYNTTSSKYPGARHIITVSVELLSNAVNMLFT